MSNAHSSNSSESRATSEEGAIQDFNRRNGKVHSSFRITPLVELLGNLCAAKESVLRLMRFDGLMKLPKDETETERPFKLRFAFWLLMKMDPITGDLNLKQNGRIEITDQDVGLVFGLPCWGEEMEAHDASKLQKNKEIVRRNLLLQSGEEIDLETIKKVILRDINDDRDGALARSFMTAVVIYAVSCFLAPKGRPPRVNMEIFDSISDPTRILRLNWASYVIRTLREASAKLKSDILSGKSSVCLDGCLLFLQVVYLDNIKAGVNTTCQYKWPRVADFSYAKLRELIMIDKHQANKDNGEEYGESELRHPAESFYTRGVLYRQRLKRLERGSTKLPLEYEMEKVLDCIDEENMEHKSKIMKQMVVYAKELCRISDRHCEGVKDVVSRWVSVGNWKNKEINIGLRSYPDLSSGKFAATSVYNAGSSDGRSGGTQGGEISGEKELKSDAIGRMTQRCGIKRAANRTPIAIRRACSGNISDEEDYDEDDFFDELWDGSHEKVSMNTNTAENKNYNCGVGCEQIKVGRSKHPSKKTVLPKNARKSNTEDRGGDEY